MISLKPSINIRHAKDRFHTKTDWLDSYHSFSFGPHYDPANTHHGFLRVSNDDIIKAGTGFPTHSHANMEIITWVLSGEIKHQDSIGNKGIITPGLAQRMSAGRGIRHSEMNPRADCDVHLIQMWILPDTEGIVPSYEQKDITMQLDSGGLVPIASGQAKDGAIFIHQRGAMLWGGRLKTHESVMIPDAPFVHLYIAKGAAQLEGAGLLTTGDAARLTSAGGLQLTASEPVGAEALIWEMKK